MIMAFFKRLGDIAAGTIVVHERSVKSTGKYNTIEKEIESRGLTKESLSIDDWALRAFGMTEWNLLKRYSERLLLLERSDRTELTKRLSVALFPRIGTG